MRASAMQDKNDWGVDAELEVSSEDCRDTVGDGLPIDGTRCERSAVNSGLSESIDGCVVVVKLGSVTRGEFVKSSIVMLKPSRGNADSEKSQAGRSTSNGRVELAKCPVCEAEYWGLDWETSTGLFCNCGKSGFDADNDAEYMH